VPPEWRSQIERQVMGEDSLLSRTDQQPRLGQHDHLPGRRDDRLADHRRHPGLLGQRGGDDDAVEARAQGPHVKLHRLTALVPVTRSCSRTRRRSAAYVSGKAGEKIAFKVNDAIVNGTGVGQPLGIMNAPCKVTVTKETSQTAATFHADNAVKMMARMPAQSFGRSVWLINQDVVPFILKLGFAVTKADGTAAGAGALYLPPNGLPTRARTARCSAGRSS
jgi:HK97 family phage major capsid protein